MAKHPSEQFCRLKHSGRATSGATCMHFNSQHGLLLLRAVHALPPCQTALPCCHLIICSTVQGVMFQCRHVLKPDGLFLAAMFGGQTLQVRRCGLKLALLLSCATC